MRLRAIILGPVLICLFGCQTKAPDDQCEASRKMLEKELLRLESLRAELDQSHWVKEFLADSMDLQQAKIARLIVAKVDCDLNIGRVLTDASSPNRKLRFVTWDSNTGGTMTFFSSVTLVDNELDTFSITKRYYESVDSVYEFNRENGAGPFYAVLSFGKWASNSCSYSVRVFELDQGLHELSIFPGASSFLQFYDRLGETHVSGDSTYVFFPFEPADDSFSIKVEPERGMMSLTRITAKGKRTRFVMVLENGRFKIVDQ